MIWGLALEPGNEYTRTSEDEVHLSLAAIESRAEFGKAGSYSQVVLKTEDSEQLLCTLVHGTIFQQCLDLKLMAGEKVTFSVQGSCTVYITGYSFRTPLEPAADPADQAEGMETGNMTSYDEPLPYIKKEGDASDEDNSAEEQRVKQDEEEQDSKRLTDGTEQGVQVNNNDDGEDGSDNFLSEDQQSDRAAKHSPHSQSPDAQRCSHQSTTGQASQVVIKTENLSDEVDPTAESQNGAEETHQPGPSRSTARTRSTIQLGSTDAHRRENGNSWGKKMKTEVLPGGGTNNVKMTADTSDRTKKVPFTPLAGRATGSSTNVEAGSVSDHLGQRSKVTEPPKAVVPGTQSSPGASKQLPSPEDKYVCPLCSEVFPGKDSLLVHEQKHAQEGKMFSCRYCHMVFLQKGNRNIHERIHSAMRHNIRAAYKNQSDLKEKSRKASLDDVMKEGKGDTSKPVLSSPPPPPPPPERHKPSHSQRRERAETKSSVRSRPYPHYSGLGLRAAHQPVEEKNYRCQFCDKPFKRNYDRNRHERIHTGQKPYECSYCDQAFSRREHCKKHEFTHLKSRPTDD